MRDLNRIRLRTSSFPFLCFAFSSRSLARALLGRAVVVVSVWHRFGCFSSESGIGSRWELSRRLVRGFLAFVSNLWCLWYLWLWLRANLSETSWFGEVSLPDPVAGVILWCIYERLESGRAAGVVFNAAPPWFVLSLDGVCLWSSCDAD